MANLRQLSVFSLSLAFLAGSSFSLNCDAATEQLKNPPPSKTVFYEADLWQQDANKEWAFSHLLLSAIRTPDAAKIDKLQVTDDTKDSIHTIRHEFLNTSTQNNVQTSHLSDLVYAYSWSNVGATSYMFSGLQAIKNGLQAIINKVMSVDEYATNKVSFYKEHKTVILGTTGAAVGVPVALYGITQLCSAPAANPAQGWIWAGITGSSYVAAIYLAYAIGNAYYDVPLALKYYTDRIAGGDGSAQAGTYTDTFYGFSQESAEVHFRWYINMNTYNTMLRGFLSHGKRMNQLQFGAIPSHAESLLDRVSNNRYLTEVLYTPYLPDYFDRLGKDYSTSRTEHRLHVKELVNKVVDPENPADDCRKYVLFNDAIFSDNPNPLYLFSLCSVGYTFAYAKLPGLPYARMKKTEAVSFVQELMEYTGSTRLVVMFEKK